LAVLVAATAVLADRAPLWNDELFTYYIGGLPTAGDVWSELATGVEQTPFSFYLVTQAALEVLGKAPLAMRVPEILGFALMSICVFHFVARRSSPVYGFVAILFPLVTTAYGYAYEARAYALVLGFSAAALLCWQWATEGGPHRRLAALGIALSLAAAVGSHYYAVLMLVPLLVGEAGRSLSRRRIDWVVVGSFSGALVPLLLFSPLIQAAQGYSTTFWARPTWNSAVRFYLNLLLDRTLLAAAGLIFVVIFTFTVLRSSSRSSDRQRPFVRPPDHELLALGTLVLLPFFGVLLGKLVTGGFTGRYALSAVIGVTVLVALTAWWADREAPIVGVSLMVVLTVLAGLRFSTRYDQATRDEKEQIQALQFLEQHSRAGLPIVISSPHDFFELSHRAAEEGGPRLLYLADPALAVKYLQTDAVDLGVLGLEDIAPLRVEPYRSFVASHSRFLLYGEHGAWDWVTSALRAQGADVRVAARNPLDGDVLVEVRRR